MTLGGTTLLLLLTERAALAHLPHDIVDAVAVPDSLDDSRPWLLVAEPSANNQQLLRSTDGGLTWGFVGGPPLVDRLLDAAQTADGRSVLLGGGRLWWTDDGTVWETTDLDGDVSLIEARGDEIVVAGGSGIFAVSPDGTQTLELDSQIIHLAPGPGGLAALDRSGVVWVDDGQDWVPIGTPAAQTISAVAADSNVFAATRDGTVHRYDGESWHDCGAVPDTGGLPDITMLSASGSALLATPAGIAPVVSRDGCATWDISRGLVVSFGGSGGASGADDAWSVLRATDERWLVGGWGGLVSSDDGGDSWRDATLLPADYSRGVAFSPRFSADGTAWFSSYMGGVMRTVDGGATWMSASWGLTETNAQDVAAHPSQPLRVAAIVGHVGWRSDDGGLSWRRIAEDMDYVGSILTDEEGVYVQGSLGDGVMALVHEPWAAGAPRTLPTPPPGGHPALVTIAGQQRLCETSRDDGSVFCLDAAQQGWSTLVETDAARGTRLTQLPDGTLLFGHGDAVLESVDDGVTWDSLPLLDDDLCQALVATSTGDAFLTTRVGRFYRRDGSGTWTDLGIQLRSPANALAARPDFDQHPQLVAATTAGGVLIDLEQGAAQTRPFAPIQWIDDHSGYLCPPCDKTADSTASFGSAALLSASEILTTTARGDSIALRGRLDPGQELTLTVRSMSGLVEATTTADSTSSQVTELARVAGLSDGWHQVSVTGTEGAIVDVVLAESPVGALPYDRTTATGCSTQPRPRFVHAILLLLGFALTTRRSRR